MSHNADNRARQPQGQPTGGQFAEEAMGSSGIALAEPSSQVDQFVAGLSDGDRRLVEALLDVDSGYFADREDAYDQISNFGGYGGGDLSGEVEMVGSQLTSLYDNETEVLRSPFLSLDRNEHGDVKGYTVSAHVANGTKVSVFRDVSMATYAIDASGTDAAMSMARAIDDDYCHVIAERDRLFPPSMERMRAAVQVDSWRAAGAKVQFVANEDGPVEEATIRTGRYADAEGSTHLSPDADDRQGYVRFTMSNTGIERFYPWSQVEDMVVGHRIARED